MGFVGSWLRLMYLLLRNGSRYGMRRTQELCFPGNNLPVLIPAFESLYLLEYQLIA